MKPESPVIVGLLMTAMMMMMMRRVMMMMVLMMVMVMVVMTQPIPSAVCSDWARRCCSAASMSTPSRSVAQIPRKRSWSETTTRPSSPPLTTTATMERSVRKDEENYNRLLMMTKTMTMTVLPCNVIIVM